MTSIAEFRRTRSLLLVLPRGAELPRDLVLALDQAEVKSAWIEGTGSLSRVDLAIGDGPSRRVEGPCEIVTLSGNATSEQGQTVVHVGAVLARETDVGLETVAGRVVGGSVRSLSLLVTALEDVRIGKLADEREAASRSAAPPAVEPLRASLDEPPAPPRRPRPSEDDDAVWPEPGDLVNHFHFGECAVISSDGERIRLRQEQGGRVREVALTMLKIEAPTIDPVSGRRHFRLGRKN